MKSAVHLASWIPSMAILLVISSHMGLSQSVGINTDGSSPHPSAILDVKSTSQGLLAPRMTQAERLAISTPAEGLMVYQTNTAYGYYYYNGTPNLYAQSGAGSTVKGKIIGVC